MNLIFLIKQYSSIRVEKKGEQRIIIVFRGITGLLHDLDVESAKSWGWIWMSFTVCVWKG
jgi:hypothetical protein